MSSFSIVTFDIDGTLTMGHGWYYIAKSLGRLSEYNRTTEEFRRGVIGEDEHLANLLNLAAGFPARKVHGILERTPRLENIGEGMGRLRKEGLRIYLLTHNPAYVCEWYMERFGIDGFRGARQAVRNGVVCRTARVHADKVAWMNDICALECIAPERVVHVGDGVADEAVFGRAGMGIAVNTKLRSTRRGASVSVNTTDMLDVVREIIGRLS